MVLLDVRHPVVIQRNPRATPSSLSIIETAYDLETDDTTWLSALVRELQPFLDDGLGLYGHFYEFDQERSLLRVDSAVFLGCQSGLQEVLARATAMMPSNHVQAHYLAPPCRSLSQVHADLGVVHTLSVNAWQGETRGCCFMAPLARVRRFPVRIASALSRAARHIAAAQRLRRAVRRSEGQASLEAEAVLDAQGAVLHAEGEARSKFERELLSSTAKSLVGAQQRWRETDPEQVTATWNALIDGRWSLVDSFDRDGKRFLLARRNALEVREPASLGPAERQVAALFARGHSNKLVAYELGLSATAVSGTLQRALRKLQLRSRTELVALFGALTP